MSDQDLFDFFGDIDTVIDRLNEKLQRDGAIRREKILASKTNFIADHAHLCWSKGDLQFFLCEHPIHAEGRRVQQENPKLYSELSIYKKVGRYNGYVRFPSLPMIVPGFKGILTYVPVHGGITYFQDWWDASVTYGFDVGHLISESMLEIISDIGWMMAETEGMARGIQIAARFEPYYLNARTEEQKARVLDRMGRFMPLDIHGNTGAMLKLLSGSL
ncbi:MAG TPA: hypothetical protein VK638_44500 [Edaphobacter sp.]|nr:hypothetical protein [Edaphobacter sp.]